MIRIVSFVWTVMMLLFFATGTVDAGEAVRGGPASDDKQRQLLTQKLLLLDNILSRSTSAVKMKQSDNPEVVKMVLQAQENTKSARSDLAQGHLIEGSRKADEALKMLTSAGSLTSQVQKSTLMQRSRYRELMLALDALSKAPQFSQADDEVNQLVSQAKDAVVRDDYRSANKSLGDALELKAAKMASMYDQKTIVYALDFDTPVEEYQYEAKQFEGNQLLIELMLENAQQSTSNDVVSRYVDEAQQFSQEASQQSNKGNFTDAIGKMEQANEKLASALEYLGVEYK